MTSMTMFSEQVQWDYQRNLIELAKMAFEDGRRQARAERFTDWVTMNELEERTKWSRDTLEAWRDQGEFSFIKKGNKYVYDYGEVDAFLRRKIEKKKI